MKIFTKHLIFSNFQGITEVGDCLLLMWSHYIHKYYWATAMSIGTLSLMHVILGHCPVDRNTVPLSIEHFVPLDVTYTNCNSIEIHCHNVV